MSMEHLTVFISPQPLPIEIHPPATRPDTPTSFHFLLDQMQKSSPRQQMPAPVKTPIQPLHIPVRTPVQSANPVFHPPLSQPAIKPFQALADKESFSVAANNPKIAEKQTPPQMLNVAVTGLLLIETPLPKAQLHNEPSAPVQSTSANETVEQTALFWASLAFQALSKQLRPIGFGQAAPPVQSPALGFHNKTEESSLTLQGVKPGQTVDDLGFASALPLKLQVTLNYQLIFFVALRSQRKALWAETDVANSNLNTGNISTDISVETPAIQAPVAADVTGDSGSESETNTDGGENSEKQLPSVHQSAIASVFQITEAPVTPIPVAQAPVAETPVTPVPVAQAPVAEAPVAPTPVAQAPVAETPVTPVPVAQAPVAEAPVTPTPVAQAPVAEATVTPTPIAQTPVAETPVTPAPVAQAPVAEAPVAPAPLAQAPVAETPVAPAPLAQAPHASELLLGELRVRILLLAKQGVYLSESSAAILPPSQSHEAKAPKSAEHWELTSQVPVSARPDHAEANDPNASVPFTLELVSAGLAASFLNFSNESGSFAQSSGDQKTFQQIPLLSQNWFQGELSVAAMEAPPKPSLLTLSPEKPWWLEVVEAASEPAASPERLQTALSNAAEQEEESGFPWEALVKPLLQASTAPPLVVPKRSSPAPQVSFASIPPMAAETRPAVQAQNLSETAPAEDKEEAPAFKPENSLPSQAPLAPLPFSLPPQALHFHKAAARSAGLAILSWGKAESAIEKSLSPAQTSPMPEVEMEQQAVPSGLKVQLQTNTVRIAQSKPSAEEVNPAPVNENKAKSQQTLFQDRSVAPHQAMSAQTAIQLHNQGVPLQVSDFPAFVNQVLQTRNFKVGALQSIEVTLNPQNLGKVNAHFMLKEQNEMVVRLYAPNAVAAKTLETYVQDIQQMIQKSYLVAGQVEIKQGIPPARGPQGGNTSGQNSDFASRQSSWRKGSNRRRKKDDDMSVDVTV